MPQEEAENSIYLTPCELVLRYKRAITKRTLANWRSKGEGPPYVKIGGKVLYRISDILKWERRRSIINMLQHSVGLIATAGGCLRARGSMLADLMSLFPPHIF